jgi:hypothetical protein
MSPRKDDNGRVKALTITAQPKPEAGWVHRFRNFGENVYADLRASCEVNIEEIDAAFDEFHVRGVCDEDVDVVAGAVAALNRAHHLEGSVFVSVNDEPVYHQTVVLVLDTAFGERLWEIAGRHPMWVVGSDVNKAAVDEMRSPDEPGKVDVTIWSSEFELLTERDWLGALNTLDMHHGAFASEPAMNKLSVYGAAASSPVVAALREFGFGAVIPTASGFIALQEWRGLNGPSSLAAN